MFFLTLASILAASYGMINTNPLNAICCLLAYRQDLRAPSGVFLSGHDNNMRSAGLPQYTRALENTISSGGHDAAQQNVFFLKSEKKKKGEEQKVKLQF